MELSTILRHNLPGEYKDRKVCMTHSLATLIAMELPIPTSPVRDFESWYNSVCHISVVEMCDTINEHLVVDQKLLQRSVLSMTRFRYELVHEARSIGTVVALAQASVMNRNHHTPDQKAVLTQRGNLDGIEKVLEELARYRKYFNPNPENQETSEEE